MPTMNSVFGGLGGKKKKRNKRHKNPNELNQLNNIKEVEPSFQPLQHFEHPIIPGEIRFVLPRSTSSNESSQLSVPFLFKRQKQLLLEQHQFKNGEDSKEMSTLIKVEGPCLDESIEDILFPGKKKAGCTDPPSSIKDNFAKTLNLHESKVSQKRKKELSENEDKSDYSDKSPEVKHPLEKDSKKLKKHEYNEHQCRNINARSVEDAVEDKIGRRPRANSTDNELHLPRRGLCDECVILKSHKWNMLRLYNRSGSAVQNPPPPRGMVNLGNTCFINATLQCLLYLPTFCQSITSLPDSCYEEFGNDKHTRGQRMTMILRNLSRTAHGISTAQNNQPPRSDALVPKAVLNAITSCKTGSHRFRLGRQEDAHELLVHLLDAMHEGELFAAGINPHSSGWREKLPISRLDETTFVHRIFGGYFRSQLQCNKCGYKSNTYDPFLDLALEVSRKHIHSLDSAFAEFTRKETLDSFNRWKCSGCEKHVCPTKLFSIFRPPLSLCIHLKRFNYSSGGSGKGGLGIRYGHRHGKGLSMTGGGGSKVTKPIRFPVHLSLPLSDGRVCEYNLTGIIVHVGNSATTGHYTAFVKKPGENTHWYHMDDSYVETVSEKTVLKQRDVYVLFYTRIEVKLEFPQPPPREHALDIGIKSNVMYAKASGDSSSEIFNNTVMTKESLKEKRNLSLVEREFSLAKSLQAEKYDKPGIDSSVSQNTSICIDENHRTTKTLPFKSSPSISESSFTSLNKLTSVSLQSDSNGTKTPYKAAIISPDAEGSLASDIESPKPTQNTVVDVKESINLLRTHSKPLNSKTSKKLYSKNVEVVISRKDKRPWKPQESAKVVSGIGNALLGNVAISNWDDDNMMPIKSNSEELNKKQSVREVALQEMESADRVRKRQLHLDRWDAMIDAGKQKKVKTKSHEHENLMKTNSDSFHRIQRDMQRISKGGAKGFRSSQEFSGRVFSLKKRKRKSSATYN